MIWIRADANERIGSGHVMRCLSVASALKARGEEVRFLIADERSAGLLEQYGQAYHILGTDYTRMESELDVLSKLYRQEKPAALLVDSYFVTQRYLSFLSGLAETSYMDDIPLFAYPVQKVINYNIYGEVLPYGENAVDEKQEFLLGPKYAPLREQFWSVEYTVRPSVKDVLVTTGGSDKYNLAELLLREFLGRERLKYLQYHVVSGALNTNYPALSALSLEYENLQLYRNVTDMAGLMKKCDVAVTAGGSTMYELSAVGVPTLCFSFVDNQEQIVDTFFNRELVAYGGSFLREGDAFASNVAKALERLLESNDSRRIYSRRMRELTDGRGADRIAEALCRTCGRK